MSDVEKVEDVGKFEKFLNTTSIRENIINWYDFKDKANILEIGGNCDVITSFLIGKSAKFTELEVNNKFADEIRLKYKDMENFNLIESNLIDEYVKNLSSSLYLVTKYQNYNRNLSPYLITISKNKR